METKYFSALSEQLLSHITGGASKEIFTCVYDREKKKQEAWYDDSKTEEKLRPVE